MLMLKILVIGAAITTAFVIDDGCPKECDCIGTRIDCNSKQLKSVPKSTNKANSFTEISLSYNSILKLDFEAFSSYPHLKKIVIHSSGVVEIDQYAFSDLKDLKEVHLGNNYIKNLDRNVFDFIPHLEILDLHRNPLNLTAEFPFPDSIKFLDLRRCHLDDLPDHILGDHEQIETLDLRHNDLQTISHVIFELPKITRIYLHGNPWSCDVEPLLLSKQDLIPDYKKVRCFTPDGTERPLQWIQIPSTSLSPRHEDTTASSKDIDDGVQVDKTLTQSDGGSRSTTIGAAIREPAVTAIENVTSPSPPTPGSEAGISTSCIIILVFCIISILLLVALGYLFCKTRKPSSSYDLIHT